MGLDQTLNWIGEPSRSQITRLKHKDLSELNYTNGMSYISEEDYKWSMDEYEGYYSVNGYDPDETGYISEKLCNPIKLVAAKVVEK